MSATGKPEGVAVEQADGYDGYGWYWWDEDYPHEGTCGAFDTEAEAIDSARQAYTEEPGDD